MHNQNYCANIVKRGRTTYRDVAQLGSAPGLGPGGRRFESCHPDYTGSRIAPLFYFLHFRNQIVSLKPPRQSKADIAMGHDVARSTHVLRVVQIFNHQRKVEMPCYLISGTYVDNGIPAILIKPIVVKSG